MNAALSSLRERLTTSIWLIPMGLCALSMALALLLIWIDRQAESFAVARVGLAMELGAARNLLSLIAGSIIGVGGVAFSITMVALTLTSGQYGPKILRHFLADNNSKVSLGLFIGTYVYALGTLWTYGPQDQPRFSVLGAILLALAALIGFVRFIHRTASDLQADQIVLHIGSQMRSALRQLAAPQSLAGRSEDTLPWRRRARGLPVAQVLSTSSGYVQSIDYPGLVELCDAHDCLAMVRARAGDFLIQGTGLLQVYGGIGRDLATELNACVSTGPIRTPVQDPEFPITQLNQLAARALSPGINDPGTAITCIDWLALALTDVVDSDLPGSVFLGEGGQPRLLVRHSHFAGTIKAVYAPLRQLSRANVAVTATLFESLCRLASLTARADRHAILARHGRLIWDQVEGLGLPDYDRLSLRRRYRKLVALTGH